MATDTVTQARLKELVSYDPLTGVFTWNVAPKYGHVGDVFGSQAPDGYLLGKLDKRSYRVHRLAWLYMTGQWPVHQVDHINHVRNDNRIANLRDVTSAQNHHNRRRATHSSSGSLGVGWHKRDKIWQAHIERAGVRLHLGYFSDLDDALAARKNAELLIHPSRPA
jgi:hypothetical protein